MTTSNIHYTTSDSSLATYLLTEGFELLDIDYSNPRYVYVFNGNIDTLKEYEHKYITSKAKVDPSVYSRVNRKLMRAIKNRLQWSGA